MPTRESSKDLLCHSLVLGVSVSLTFSMERPQKYLLETLANKFSSFSRCDERRDKVAPDRAAPLTPSFPLFLSHVVSLLTRSHAKQTRRIPIDLISAFPCYIFIVIGEALQLLSESISFSRLKYWYHDFFFFLFVHFFKRFLIMTKCFAFTEFSAKMHFTDTTKFFLLFFFTRSTFLLLSS